MITDINFDSYLIQPDLLLLDTNIKNMFLFQNLKSFYLMEMWSNLVEEKDFGQETR